MNAVGLILLLTAFAGEIRLPLTPAAAPLPDDPAKPIDTIRPDEWYVITSTERLIALSSPEGLVTVTEDKGPARYRGRFAGGSGIETRAFGEEWIYLVEPVKPGKTELILIPVGAESAEAVVRQVLTVSGTGPQPPPEPEPGPEPEPQPRAKHLQIAIVEDTLNRTPQTAICLNALVTANDIRDAGHEWRIYDIKTREAKGVQALTDSAGTLPAIVFRDLENGKLIEVAPLPKTITDLRAAIKRLTE